ncbi:MAG: 1-acyl-sn-glycerol-3-phosphate acyltransferase [Candidatus Omnitrophica bacterium CG_4_10_14_0_2_um_filter_44_9]|nr:MAG: 1-acyl-sn-glycerol-3-phosphate acyltransferase [Candidatus Omnitrophica bacterium CG_4_10_14_0_8_um_filter_44_12]PIZ83214.1 MAG: 1-acyl-sn-glycerol-3-phosphate acyltransferase [Candidatus Omnitrophica bacterium CG_4_10_14_0_2_um_filter_44_9]
MIYVAGRWFCALFCRLFFRLRVEGREQVPKKGAFIIAGNHVSFLDPVVFGVACPRQLNYLARDTLFRNKFFGWLLKSVHVISLKRNAADICALREGLRRLKAGQGLLLFPEGTRSTDGNLGIGHYGVGFFARKSGAPVVPAYSKGALIAMPKGATSIKPVPISVVFGKPMDFAKYANISDQEIADEIMKQLRILKDESSK